MLRRKCITLKCAVFTVQCITLECSRDRKEDVNLSRNETARSEEIGMKSV